MARLPGTRVIPSRDPIQLLQETRIRGLGVVVEVHQLVWVRPEVEKFPHIRPAHVGLLAIRVVSRVFPHGSVICTVCDPSVRVTPCESMRGLA